MDAKVSAFPPKHLLDFMRQGLEIGVPPDASENCNLRIAGGSSMSLTEKRDLR